MQTQYERRIKWHLERLYAKAGGVDAVAAITGYRPTIVKAWRTKGTPAHIPGAALQALERATGDFDCSREHVSAAPEPAPVFIHSRLLEDLTRDSAEVVCTTIRALDDGVVTLAEANEIAPLADALRCTATELFQAAAAVRPIAVAAE